MSDPARPRPQYGEYATPEEQRAAIKAPETNVHYAPPSAEEHPANTPPPPDAREPHLPFAAPPEAETPAASRFLRHPVDRVVTIALLVLGLYNVVSTFAGRGQIADQIDQAYRSLGLTGDYASTATTELVANVVAVIFLVLWIVAAVFATLMITRGRIAFWIPLGAGVLASLVSGIGYLILFLHDPTFIQYMQQAG